MPVPGKPRFAVWDETTEEWFATNGWTPDPDEALYREDQARLRPIMTAARADRPQAVVRVLYLAVGDVVPDQPRKVGGWQVLNQRRREAKEGEA